jgi:hypothetical protein
MQFGHMKDQEDQVECLLMGRNGPNRSVLLVGGPLQIGDPDDSFDNNSITRRSKTTSFSSIRRSSATSPSRPAP